MPGILCLHRYNSQIRKAGLGYPGPPDQRAAGKFLEHKEGVAKCGKSTMTGICAIDRIPVVVVAGNFATPSLYYPNMLKNQTLSGLFQNFIPAGNAMLSAGALIS